MLIGVNAHVADVLRSLVPVARSGVLEFIYSNSVKELIVIVIFCAFGC